MEGISADATLQDEGLREARVDAGMEERLLAAAT